MELVRLPERSCIVNTRYLMFVLALFAAGGVCSAGDNASSERALDRFSYSQYGFELFLPRGTMRHVSPLPPGVAGLAEAFSWSGLGAAVIVANVGVQESLSLSVDRLAREIGVSRTGFKTPQGVDFAGASGILTLTRQMVEGAPASLQLRPGMRAKISVYAARLPSDTTLGLVLVFVGPAERSSEVDSLAQTVLDSINFTGLKRPENAPAAGAAAPGTQSQGLTLSPGQIALRGRVESISAESKSLTMLADEVIAYGKSAVTLSPARRKVINYSSLPDGVAAGSRIMAIGPNSGTGKPMNAVKIVQEK